MSETETELVKEEDSQVSRKTFFIEEPFVIGDQSYSANQVWQLLGSRLTEARQKRILEVCRQRTDALVPVLENLYDRGNISAVMRSAEAFGYYRVHVVNDEAARFKAANRVTQGTDKWLHIQSFRRIEDSLQALRQEGYQIYATHLEASVSIEELDLTRPTAVVFGNEKSGVSAKALEIADGRFLLPMRGFAQSFNISVAAALTFFYAYYKGKPKQGEMESLSSQRQLILAANYALRSFDQPEKLLRKLVGVEK